MQNHHGLRVSETKKFFWFASSISIPYKEAALAYCDEVEPLAKVSPATQMRVSWIAACLKLLKLWYLLCSLDLLLQAIGAVNTIARRKSDGKLVGYNTDCDAAITAIEEGLNGTSFDINCPTLLTFKIYFRTSRQSLLHETSFGIDGPILLINSCRKLLIDVWPWIGDIGWVQFISSPYVWFIPNKISYMNCALWNC